jgi:poly(A) polymerase
MRHDGVLTAILPEAARLDRLETLVRPRGDVSIPVPNALLRLAALIDVDRTGAIALAERLRLPSKDRRYLAEMAKPWPIDAAADATAQRLALYRIGHQSFLAIVMLLEAEGGLPVAKMHEMFDRAGRWEQPVFPIGGDDVTALGIAPGPRVGRLLGAVRRWWEDGDFAADRVQCLVRLRELASRF